MDWKPILAISTKIDAIEKVIKIHQFELEHKAEYDDCMKRKREYKTNCYKAYTEIWERCNKAMKSKIEARKN